LVLLVLCNYMDEVLLGTVSWGHSFHETLK